ncbi:protein G6b isoform X3 [Heterocephalus glaber]|uniref:Protein G6b isoform X3 n=1 Tax=Heterocephalus glaber TaxID=10181 RepID=A0AAX6T7G1_HETGA|nr:protein G6b isoform X3 [Heterocephalus glaber]
MALALRLLALLLSRAGGDPGASLLGRPGDRVNLSCVGVSHPIRWAWAPSFPACQGLSKGRRPILWASTGEIPTVPPPLPFAGRLRSLDPGVRRLELLVSAGDSGNFICKGPQEEESRTLLHVLGDRADCRAPGPARGSGYPQVLIPLLGAGLALGLGALGVVWWLRRACCTQIWTTRPSGGPAGCPQWPLLMPPLSMPLWFEGSPPSRLGECSGSLQATSSSSLPHSSCSFSYSRPSRSYPDSFTTSVLSKPD